LFAVEMDNVKVYIGNRQVLKGVTLKVYYNTIFVIMGPSGSGKTTLLRVINRLIDVVEGARVEGHVKSARFLT